MRAFTPVLVASLFAVLSSACAAAAPIDQAPVQQQGPEGEILAIASTWEARSQDNGLRSEPSKISVFTVQALSVLEFTLGSGTARESVLLEESFRLRDGRKFNCRSETALEVKVRYFRKGDEPAIEVLRPDVELARSCDQPGFPEPMVQLGATRGAFLLRGENLVGFDPPLEKRSYIPVQ